MRRRFSEEQWRNWLAEFRRSGMSVAAFCRKINVCQNSFYLWRRKLGYQSSSSLSQQALVPVQVVSPESIRIQLPGGASTECRIKPNRCDRYFGFFSNWSLIDDRHCPWREDLSLLDTDRHAEKFRWFVRIDRTTSSTGSAGQLMAVDGEGDGSRWGHPDASGLRRRKSLYKLALCPTTTI